MFFSLERTLGRWWAQY